jgi:glycosyltransferase involved in cell wall biosynthesis
MRVLLIPEMYPSEDHPNAGVFMQDQVRALSSFAETLVFNTNPYHRGAYRETDAARFYDFHLFENRWPGPLNALAYAIWERQAFRVAKRIPKPDLIHLHGAALRGGLAAKLAEHWGVPLAVTEHTGPWSTISDRPYILRRVKKVMEAADCVMPVSRHLADEIKASGIHPGRLEVLGNPVNTELFALRNNALTSVKNILYLGRLDGFKGAFRTLRAFAKVAEQLLGYTLTIAGEGEEAEVIRLYIDANELEGRVEFHEGFFFREQMLAHFHRASFLVFPSIHESFGLVPLEAMSTGLPALLTDRTGPRDFFDPKVGIQVDPESEEAIAEGMLAMVARIGEFDSKAIRKHVVDGWGVECFSERLEKCYKDLA